ncbi:MAG: outer membrane lipoprotein carrier protein LolA, partial [Phycisphaerae bacterium]|nr:outer membrane lipoprotein carrier protein LolA [Phycisphaerae bacterium]
LMAAYLFAETTTDNPATEPSTEQRDEELIKQRQCAENLRKITEAMRQYANTDTNPSPVYLTPSTNPATQPALPQPVLYGLGKRLGIRVEADSWDALVKKVKPTFTWSGRDMMWADKDEKGNPQFTLDRAHVYKPKGKPAKWVLLTFQNAPFAVFGWNDYLPGIAKLHKKVPIDRRSVKYALVKSTNPKGGTVYEIVWQSAMSLGIGSVAEQRHLFVLQNAKGKWRFLGEGPVCSGNKMRGLRAARYTLQSKVVWTGKPNASVRIELVQKGTQTEWPSSDDDPTVVLKRDRIEYRDAVIDGKVPAILRQTTKRPYMLAQKGDTFEKIVHHLATWSSGWDANKGNDRQIILKIWRKELTKLNPQLPKGKIPEGARIRLLTYAETMQHLYKHRKAATQPTTTTSAPAVDPKVMAILKRLEAAGDKYPNITAKIDYKVDMLQTGDTESRTGKVYYQGPTEKESAKFRIHFDTLRQGKGPKIKDVVDYAFDGEWLTVRKERIKQMSRYQVARPGKKVNPLQLGKGPFPVPFGQKAQAVIKHFHPSTRPAKKTAPKNTDYLKLTTRRQYRKEFSVVWLEMWVDRKTGLPVKIVTEDRSENRTTVLFKDTKTPKSFPKKTFDLPRPPAGWEYHVEKYKGQVKP